MSEKIKKLEEKHQLEKYNIRVEDEAEKRKARAFMFIGGIHTVKNLANSLKSQELRGIETIQNEKLYLDLGFEKFVDFLDSDYSPITKNQYYDRIKVLEKEGDAVFNLLSEVGVSLSIRKKLAESNYGDIFIEGDVIKIGDDEADLSNLRMVKTLIESFSNDCRNLTETIKKQQEKVEKLEKNIATGQKEFDELRRSIDADKDRNPYDKAYVNLLIDLGNLTELAKTANLDDSRRDADIRSVFGQMLRYRDALKPNFVLLDEQPDAGKTSKINPKIAALLSEDDDWGDELEQ